MDFFERELLVARVASGTVRVTAVGRNFFVYRPSRADLYFAAIVYQDALVWAESEGLYTDEGVSAILRESGRWDDEQEKLLSSLPEQIEELKVQLFQSTFNSSRQTSVRKALAAAKAKFVELSSRKAELDHLTVSGYAALARTRHLVASGLFTSDNKKVFPEGFWDDDSSLLEEAMSSYASSRLTESQMRELARTEPWQSVWACGKNESGVFGVAACDYTDEQRLLAGWSSLYDGVRQHPQCPSEAAIRDDDMLDGWLILQRRGKGQSEEIPGSAKVRNSQEIFLPAKNREDVNRIQGLNDAQAKNTLKKRFETIRKKGEVAEGDMPDTKLRIQMEAVNARRA